MKPVKQFKDKKSPYYFEFSSWSHIEQSKDNEKIIRQAKKTHRPLHIVRAACKDKGGVLYTKLQGVLRVPGAEEGSL